MLPDRQSTKPNFPTTVDIRDIALEAAGFDPKAVGEFVRQGVDKLIEKLSATKKSYFSHEGVVQDEREDADNAAQIKAASELIALGVEITAMKRRSGTETPQKPNVVVDLSGWTVTTPLPTKDKSVELPSRTDHLDRLDE